VRQHIRARGTENDLDGRNFRRVEVLTGTLRRRRWSVAEKVAIVAESPAPGAQASHIALRYGLHRNQLYGWQREFGPGAPVTAMAEACMQGPHFGSGGGGCRFWLGGVRDRPTVRVPGAGGAETSLPDWHHRLVSHNAVATAVILTQSPIEN